jgi:hypothetical protein
MDSMTWCALQGCSPSVFAPYCPPRGCCASACRLSWSSSSSPRHLKYLRVGGPKYGASKVESEIQKRTESTQREGKSHWGEGKEYVRYGNGGNYRRLWKM